MAPFTKGRQSQLSMSRIGVERQVRHRVVGADLTQILDDLVAALLDRDLDHAGIRELLVRVGQLGLDVDEIHQVLDQLVHFRDGSSQDLPQGLPAARLSNVTLVLCQKLTELIAPNAPGSSYGTKSSSDTSASSLSWVVSPILKGLPCS